MSLSANFAWPKYTGEIHSPVIKDLSGPKQDWNILVPHEGIRVLMRMVKDVMPNFTPEEAGLKWQQACLSDWLVNTFYPIIFYHHELEEEVYIPELRKMGAEIGDKVEHEHADILPRLKEVTHRLQDKTVDVEKWKKDMTDMINDLQDHMAEEERDFGPQVRNAGITEKDLQGIMNKMMPKIPFAVMKLELPIIFYAMHTWYGDTAKVDKMFKEDGVPFIMTLMANWSWIPTFFDDTIARFESLNNRGAPFRREGWFSCSY